MNELVIFDVDNTLVRGQSQQIFLKYLLRKGLIGLFPFLKISAWFLAYKLGLANDPLKIMEYSFDFLKNWEIKQFNKLVDDFLKEKLKARIYHEAVEIIQKHQREGRNVILVSNAIQPLVQRLGKYLQISNCIGTKLEMINYKFTGKIEGEISYGKNKVKFIEEYNKKNGASLENSWAYGDHISDLPVLEIVKTPVAINPSSLLLKEAKKRNWQILYLKK